MTLPDIPRLYTALAEWLACVIYLLPMPHRLRGARLAGVSALCLAAQALFLQATDDLSEWWWLPCMAAAIGLMFVFLRLAGRSSLRTTCYACIRAFVLAEFAASFEWQFHCSIWPGGQVTPGGVLLLVLLYCALYALMGWLERRTLALSVRVEFTRAEVFAAFLIGLAVFAVSNMGFWEPRFPFLPEPISDIVNTRTLVDFAGVAILYAFYIQCRAVRQHLALENMENILQNQYLQYQQSKEAVELVNRKYHDLKHQIAALRAAPDAAQRNAYLDKMEDEIRTYEAQNKTGHPVLDTILTSKQMLCQQAGITLSCVVDGPLLQFIDVMDLCTIFGNALDNAIEYARTLDDPDKRLIHLTVSRQNNFAFIRCENYCEAPPVFEAGLPQTTKGDKSYHGFGVPSIYKSAAKYGGTATTQVENGWFVLKLLIPLP